MLLVGLGMLGFSIATGKPITIARGDRLWVMMQGILFFGLAFIAFYKATKGIPSGIAALVLSSSSLFAAIASRLLLNLRISRRTTIGIVCGLLGLGMVAAPQIFALHLNPQTVTGFIWAGIATTATGARAGCEGMLLQAASAVDSASGSSRCRGVRFMRERRPWPPSVRRSGTRGCRRRRVQRTSRSRRRRRPGGMDWLPAPWPA